MINQADLWYVNDRVSSIKERVDKVPLSNMIEDSSTATAIQDLSEEIKDLAECLKYLVYLIYENQKQ